MSRVFCARHVAGLHGQHDRVHQVLGGLDQGRGGIEAGNDELTGNVLDIGFDLKGCIV